MGFPGTGKTHVAKKIVEALREHEDRLSPAAHRLGELRSVEVCKELKDSQ